MDQDNVHGVMFEGIATVSLDGVEHDTYVTVQMETVGYMSRWYGTFGWMGEAPKGVFHSEETVMTLSDGRTGTIQIPHPSADENGKVEFLGLGSPPGFFQPEVITAELKSSTPFWRRLFSWLFGSISIVAMFAAIWVDGYLLELVTTGVLSMCLAIGFAPPRSRHLPEVPSDCPHQ